jgi:hypothetical protein
MVYKDHSRISFGESQLKEWKYPGAITIRAEWTVTVFMIREEKNANPGSFGNQDLGYRAADKRLR